MNFQADAAFAAQLDQDDPLAHYREKFHIPRHADGEEVYLCGNSLGLQPKTAERYLREELEDWQRLAVKAHFAGRRPWMPYHELLTDKTARLVGAEPQEVVNMNSLTANLHLMLVSFYRPTTTRNRILIERGAFPSDRYALASQIRFHGFDPDASLVELAPQTGRATLDTGTVEAAIHEQGERLALVLLPGVQYYSGQAFDIARLTRAAHAAGAVAGFDLAHAAGNLPLQLHDWGADFAVWCSYKYLNAGPGSVAGCFVHARHARDFERPRFAGWWGHDKTTRFRMDPEFVPIQGAQGWQLSNPPILALAPLLASLEIFDEAGMQRLREKSLRLTAYLEFLLDLRLAKDVEILTPRNPAERGCQLSLRLRGSTQHARESFRQLEERGITTDWREPDVIRVAPVPLYNTYADVYRFAEILGEVLNT
ncbi:MAG TPA: kynureninase [Gammaproteobacteria bacterium]|nr:kynureninase [Gammaproteobacteria bacterium]